MILTTMLLFSLVSQACLNLYHIANADERYLYGLMFKIAGAPACAKLGTDRQPCKSSVFSKRAMELGVSNQTLKTVSLANERSLRHCSFAERQQLNFTGISRQRIACIDYRDKKKRNALALLLDVENNQYKIYALQTIVRNHNDSALERLALKQAKPLFECVDKFNSDQGPSLVGLRINDEHSAQLSYKLANGVEGQCQIDKLMVIDKRNSAAANLVFDLEADLDQCQHPELLDSTLGRAVIVRAYKDKIMLHWAKGKPANAAGCDINPNFDLTNFFEATMASRILGDEF